MYFFRLKTLQGFDCCIYDSKVASNLDKIYASPYRSISELVLHRKTANTVRDTTFEEYEKICEAFGNIGDQFDRRFDDIEFWIFNY
jgi:hypothetical protein